MSTLISKAKAAAEREFPYDKATAKTYSNPDNYMQIIEHKRSVFVLGYINRDNEISANKRKDIVLDKDNYCVVVNGKSKQLTQLEANILSLLLSNRRKVFSQAEIAKAAWKESYLVSSGSVRSMMNKLRTKIGKKKITGIRRLGYKISL